MKKNVFLFKFNISIVFFLALILRLFHIGEESFWYDEVYSIGLASECVTSVFSVFTTWNDQVPPLFFMFLKMFILFFGNSAGLLRLLSAFSDVGAIIVTYYMANRLFQNKRLAILIAFYMSISPCGIFLSQELRYYAFSSFLASINTYFFVRLYKDEQKINLVLFILSFLACIYCHYYLGFLFVPYFVISCFSKRKILIKNLLISLFFIILGYSFWISMVFKHIVETINKFDVLVAEPLPLISRILLYPGLLYHYCFGVGLPLGVSENYFNFHNLVVACIGFIVYLSIFISLVMCREKKKNFVLILFLFPLIIACLIPVHSMNFRYVYFLFPYFSMLVCMGISKMKRKRIIIILIVLLNAYILFNYYYKIDKGIGHSEWNKTTEFVNSNISLHDIIFFDLGNMQLPFSFYNKKKFNRTCAEFPASSAEGMNEQHKKETIPVKIPWNSVPGRFKIVGVDLRYPIESIKKYSEKYDNIWVVLSMEYHKEEEYDRLFVINEKIVKKKFIVRGIKIIGYLQR